MDSIRAKFTSQQKQIRPGCKVSGEVSWKVRKLGKRQQKVTVVLYWDTCGRGSTDEEAVEVLKFPVNGRLSGTEKFKIQLPDGPSSFEGRLISLQWHLQAYLGELDSEVPFVLSETGKPVQLPSAEYNGLKGG